MSASEAALLIWNTHKLALWHLTSSLQVLQCKVDTAHMIRQLLAAEYTLTNAHFSTAKAELLPMLCGGH